MTLITSIASTLSQLPATDAEASALAKALWGFAVEKNYAAAFAPLIVLLVWALKKWDVKIPKVGPAIDAFLDKPLVSFLLPVLASAIGGFGTALFSGKPFTEALMAVVAAASSAIATFIGIKKVAEAVEAGKAAADTVVSKADAVAELKK